MAKVCIGTFWCEIKKDWEHKIRKSAKLMWEISKGEVKFEQTIKVRHKDVRNTVPAVKNWIVLEKSIHIPSIYTINLIRSKKDV